MKPRFCSKTVSWKCCTERLFFPHSAGQLSPWGWNDADVDPICRAAAHLGHRKQNAKPLWLFQPIALSRACTPKKWRAQVSTGVKTFKACRNKWSRPHAIPTAVAFQRRPPNFPKFCVDNSKSVFDPNCLEHVRICGAQEKEKKNRRSTS